MKIILTILLLAFSLSVFARKRVINKPFVGSCSELSLSIEKIEIDDDTTSVFFVLQDTRNCYLNDECYLIAGGKRLQIFDGKRVTEEYNNKIQTLNKRNPNTANELKYVLKFPAIDKNIDTIDFEEGDTTLYEYEQWYLWDIALNKRAEKRIREKYENNGIPKIVKQESLNASSDKPLLGDVEWEGGTAIVKGKIYNLDGRSREKKIICQKRSELLYDIYPNGTTIIAEDGTFEFETRVDHKYQPISFTIESLGIETTILVSNGDTCMMHFDPVETNEHFMNGGKEPIIYWTGANTDLNNVCLLTGKAPSIGIPAKIRGKEARIKAIITARDSLIHNARRSDLSPRALDYYNMAVNRSYMRLMHLEKNYTEYARYVNDKPYFYLSDNFDIEEIDRTDELRNDIRLIEKASKILSWIDTLTENIREQLKEIKDQRLVEYLLRCNQKNIATYHKDFMKDDGILGKILNEYKGRKVVIVVCVYRPQNTSKEEWDTIRRKAEDDNPALVHIGVEKPKLREELHYDISKEERRKMIDIFGYKWECLLFDENGYFVKGFNKSWHGRVQVIQDYQFQ